MSPRRPDPTKWVWCVLVLSSGPAWSTVSSTAVRTPPKIPSIIETQAKFFQDFFSVQLSPYKIEFGHVCEDPNTWEQRYEKKDFKNHRDSGKVNEVTTLPPSCFCLLTRDANVGQKTSMYRHLPTSEDFDQGYRLGNDRHFIERHERSRPAAGVFSAKVRWGDKKGGYGEHYWDLNHAGHTGNQEGDEYDDSDYLNEELQNYPEPSEKSNIDREEYYPDASEYERSARPKRENSKVELDSQIGEKNFENDRRTIKQQLNTKPTQIKRYTSREDNFDINLKEMPFKENMQKYMREYEQESRQPSNKQHIVQAIDHKIKNNYEDPVKAELRNFLPYKVGASERRFNRQLAPGLVSRLLFRSSAGNVIDRGTKQAYVLKPVYLDSRYH